MERKFDLKQLLEQKITLKDGRQLPLFFVICQTGINSTAWKGADLDKVNLVKGQLDSLLKHLNETYPEEAHAEESKEEEEGVGVADGVETKEEPNQKKTKKKQ